MICITFTLVSLVANPVYAQETNAPQSDFAAERQRAGKLLSEHRYAEALPLLEKLSQANPRDGEMFFYLGFSYLASAKILKEPDARLKRRLKARDALIKAKELGFANPLLDSLLESVPTDGGRDDIYSANSEADAAMRDGEAAYVQGQLDAAIVAYQKALAHDPKLYEAALFAGDMYFKQGKFPEAAEWFGRAVQIDPNRETAYRYSASPLMQQRKYDEAKAKYIEAIIAEPYNRLSWGGLARWAEAKGVALAHPHIEPPAKISGLKDNNINVTVEVKPDEKLDDGSAAWTMYALVRASWQTNKFAKVFPQEKTYRHSLSEELDAYRAMVESVKVQQGEGKIKKLDPMIQRAMKLYDEGLLEAFILLARPDEGIVNDYAEYRKAHRDQLRRYLLQYVIGERADSAK